MPQLSQLALVYQSQWFWLLLVLGAIYFFVGRGIVPKVEATVDQRDAQIAADLAEAEHHVEPAAFGIALLTPGFFVALAMLVVIGIALGVGVPRIIAEI